MKVELLKDVLISNMEVGASGTVHNLSKEHAERLIKRKLAKAAEDTPEAPASPEDRKTKPAKGAIETK